MFHTHIPDRGSFSYRRRYRILAFTSVAKLNSHLVVYTGWRKKNACFSNNCNFVYFQYKKIMLTSKQPVINAVLITQLRKIISERWRPSCRTHIRSLSSKFCITFTNISCGTVAISSRMETFRSSTVRGFRT